MFVTMALDGSTPSPRTLGDNAQFDITTLPGADCYLHAVGPTTKNSAHFTVGSSGIYLALWGHTISTAGTYSVTAVCTSPFGGDTSNPVSVTWVAPAPT
jgi:hypothetical protein